jgi:outer membrane lipoprotein-sorting protein
LIIKLILVAVCCALISIVFLVSNNRLNKSKVATTQNQKTDKSALSDPQLKNARQAVKETTNDLKPLTATSTAIDVMNLAEDSKNRWDSIYAEGYSSDGVKKYYFKVWAKRPDKYRLEEGSSSTLISDGITDWRAIHVTKFFSASKKHQISPKEKERLDKVMAEEAKKDPVVGRPGEHVIPAPINDIINPSYITRKELRHTAESVTKIGVREIAGRKAILIRATFGKVKEDHWDVYVDAETGIFLGFVIVPPKNQGKDGVGSGVGEATFIDKVEFNPKIAPETFTYKIPDGYRAMPSPPTQDGK